MWGPYLITPSNEKSTPDEAPVAQMVTGCNYEECCNIFAAVKHNEVVKPRGHHASDDCNVNRVGGTKIQHYAGQQPQVRLILRHGRQWILTS